jgi:hypothetical protein
MEEIVVKKMLNVIFPFCIEELWQRGIKLFQNPGPTPLLQTFLSEDYPFPSPPMEPCSEQKVSVSNPSSTSPEGVFLDVIGTRILRLLLHAFPSLLHQLFLPPPSPPVFLDIFYL